MHMYVMLVKMGLCEIFEMLNRSKASAIFKDFFRLIMRLNVGFRLRGSNVFPQGNMSDGVY